MLGVFLAVPLPVAAQSVWGDLALAGGAAAARQAMGLPRRDDDRDSTWILELVRAHAADEPDKWEALVSKLLSYQRYVLSVRTAAAAWPTGVRLPRGTLSRNERNRLNDFFELLGLRLEERRGTYQVVLRDPEESRDPWRQALGLDAAASMSELNGGGEVRLVVPDSAIPLPLVSQLRRELDDRDVTVIDLLWTRNTALRYVGLLSLDDETLASVGSRPELLRWLAGDAAPSFAVCGRSIRVRGGAIEPSGGSDAIVLWEALVDRPRQDVDRFVRTLLSEDDGRLACFLDRVQHLDQRHYGFVTGAHLTGADRARFIRRLYRLVADVQGAGWQLSRDPFGREVFDPLTLLALSDVRDDGFALPSWLPPMLEKVADNDGWPSPGEAARPPQAGRADAEWLVNWVFRDAAGATARFRLLRFAQRQFARADAGVAPAAAIMLRAMRDMPALALALERMGVASPDVVASVAWMAKRLTDSGGPNDIGPALSRWQSGLALLEQIQRRVRLPRREVEAVLASFIARVPPAPEQSRGSVGRWLSEDLLPAFGMSAAGQVDLEALRAFSGIGRSTLPVVSWEGLEYVLDEPTSVFQTAQEIRRARLGPLLDDVVALHALQRRLLAGPKTVDQVAEIAEGLRRLDRAFATLPIVNGKAPRIVRDVRDAAKALGGITRPRDVNKASRQLPVLLRAMDALTDAAVPALAYALAASPSPQPPDLVAEAWAFHRVVPLPTELQFGWKEGAWRLPGAGLRERGGMRLKGSMLGLDLALAEATLGMPRGMPTADARISDADRAALVQALAIRDQTGFVDVSETLEALHAGRAVVANLKALRGDQMTRRAALARAGVDELEIGIMLWEMNRGVDALDTLSVSQVFRLGSDADLDREWGGSAVAVDGCWCLLAPGRLAADEMRGRLGGGMATAAADLSLALGEQLSAMGLPVMLVRALLPQASADWLARIHQRSADDSAALSAWPRTITREDVEESLLSLSAAGTLRTPSPQVMRQ